jgi:hypothetical protein
MAESCRFISQFGGKPSSFLVPLSKYWGDAKVTDMNAGSIRQAAWISIPPPKNSTRNRQVIVPLSP